MNNLADNKWKIDEDMENPVAPTTIVYDDSGRLYWGYHAQELLRTQPFRFEHNSIDMIKLGLWASDTPAGGEVLDRIATLSCKKDISTIFGELLCKIVEEAKDQLPHRLNRMDRAAEVRNADVNLFLCYPYMSNLETKRAYQDAAWQSGVTSVRLVPEPHCGAAGSAASRKSDDNLNPGDYILNADIGGGTSDFCTLYVNAVSEPFCRSDLEIIGRATSAACGSHYINTELVERLKEDGTIAGIAERLRISQANVTRQIHAVFETWKCTSTKSLHREDDTIRAGSIVGSGHLDELLRLPKSTVIDSFDIVIDWNLDLIAEQLENVPAKAKVVVELPGGMGGSGYFIRRLKKRFLTRNIIVKAHSGQKRFAIARGACMRYLDPLLDQIPQNVQFGITWDEEYSAVLHPDAAKDKRLQKLSRAGTRGRDGPYCEVENRFLWIFKGRDQITDGRIHYTACVQRHYIEVNRPQPIEQTVWCTEEDIQDHAPLFVGKKRRSDVSPWKKLRKSISKRQLGAYPIKSHTNGTPSFEVFTQLVLRYRGGDLQFGWRLLNEREYDAFERGHENINLSDIDIIWATLDDTFELCSKEKNPFPMPNAC